MSRAREAEQQLAANYYGFDGFPESMFVFFFSAPKGLSTQPRAHGTTLMERCDLFEIWWEIPTLR